MIFFISARKISNFLVMGKTFHIEKSVGLFKYGKKLCKVCKNVTKTHKTKQKKSMKNQEEMLYAATSVGACTKSRTH